MDFNNHKLYKTNTIECLEGTPANISLSNEAIDDEDKINFFKYDFTNFKVNVNKTNNNVINLNCIENNNRTDNFENELFKINDMFSKLNLKDKNADISITDNNSKNIENLETNINSNSNKNTTLIKRKSIKDYDNAITNNNLIKNVTTPTRVEHILSQIKDNFPDNKFNNNYNIFYPPKIKTVNISTRDPLTFEEAISCPEAHYWIEAIKDELLNFYTNKIFTFTTKTPPKQSIVPNKWIFTTKKNDEGNIIKYKARLVALGCVQKYGFNYDRTYSPTLSYDGVKFLIAFASINDWDIQQLDIKAAYLNADLDKEIYTPVPPGDSNFGKGYWLLNKALYGLKQSGRQWNITISKFLIESGFTQISSEKCLFMKKTKNNKISCLIGLYVDDMLITGIDSEIKNIINKLKHRFKISKSGPADFILGIKIKRENNNYIISQKGFINEILDRFNIKNTKIIKTPCTITDNDKNNVPFNKTTYKSAIGSLIYLSKCTRPDIAFAVNKAARNCENPTINDWRKVINIFRYLNYTKDYKIKYTGKKEIIAYSDADYAGDKQDRKSTSGFIIFLGGAPISWISRKQNTVATSTAESEYVSTAECIKKILWLRNILYELINFNKPITIFTDNLASKISMENCDLNSKLKHIDIKYHFNKDYLEKKIIRLEYIDSNNMLADALTKDLNSNKIKFFANKIFIKEN
eukprot:jgi/Orpsp1_1/1191591/evm.model.d7180000087207.1